MQELCEQKYASLERLDIFFDHAIWFSSNVIFKKNFRSIFRPPIEHFFIFSIPAYDQSLVNNLFLLIQSNLIYKFFPINLSINPNSIPEDRSFNLNIDENIDKKSSLRKIINYFSTDSTFLSTKFYFRKCYLSAKN